MTYTTINGHKASVQDVGALEGLRMFYTFEDKTPAGEQLQVELIRVEDDGTRYSNPRRWYKNGWTDKPLKACYLATVYATDKNGFCWGRYNPQITRGNKINFAWVFEATEQSKNKLLAEILRRAYKIA